jgi:hypothetical protein
LKRAASGQNHGTVLREVTKSSLSCRSSAQYHRHVDQMKERARPVLRARSMKMIKFGKKILLVGAAVAALGLGGCAYYPGYGYGYGYPGYGYPGYVAPPVVTGSVVVGGGYWGGWRGGDDDGWRGGGWGGGWRR